MGKNALQKRKCAPGSMDATLQSSQSFVTAKEKMQQLQKRIREYPNQSFDWHWHERVLWMKWNIFFFKKEFYSCSCFSLRNSIVSFFYCLRTFCQEEFSQLVTTVPRAEMKSIFTSSLFTSISSLEGSLVLYAMVLSGGRPHFVSASGSFSRAVSAKEVLEEEATLGLLFYCVL